MEFAIHNEMKEMIFKRTLRNAYGTYSLTLNNNIGEKHSLYWIHQWQKPRTV